MTWTRSGRRMPRCVAGSCESGRHRRGDCYLQNREPHHRRGLRDDGANSWCADPPSGVMPHQLDQMLGFLITEPVLGEFGLDVVPEARSRLVCLSALAVIGGMATAAAVAGIVAAGLRDRSVIVVAGALATVVVVAIVGLLSTTLRGLAIVTVAGVLSAGSLVAIAAI